MTVYIVTRGYYDDYEIVSVWSSQELAEACVAKLQASESSEYTRRSIRWESWAVDEDEVRDDRNITA